MNLAGVVLTCIAAWVGGTIVEATLIYIDRCRIDQAAKHDRQLCGACRRDLINFNNARHAGRYYAVDYLASIAIHWPIYRGRQLLELAHLVPYKPRHDGPCTLAQPTPAATHEGCQAHQRRPE